MLKTHLQTIHVISTLPHSRKGLELFKETKVANFVNNQLPNNSRNFEVINLIKYLQLV